MELGNILTTVLENLAKLLPVRIVKENEQAVRWTLGKAGPNLDAGWYLFVPLAQSIDIVNITIGPLELHEQLVGTEDKQQCTIVSGLVWKVNDARKYLIHIGDEDSARNLYIVARGVISEVIRPKQYDLLRTDQNRVERDITDRLRNKVKEWGMYIERVHISEYPNNVRAFRHYGIAHNETGAIV